MYRRFIFRMVVRLIRKYFQEGVSVITNADEDIIAYRWTWSKEMQDCTSRKVQKEAEDFWDKRLKESECDTEC